MVLLPPYRRRDLLGTQAVHCREAGAAQDVYKRQVQGLAAFTAAGGNSESYLRVDDERGHCDVYGGTGAFSETGKGIAPINKKRIIRILEIYHSTGKTKTEQEIESRKNEVPYNYIVFAINTCLIILELYLNATGLLKMFQLENYSLMLIHCT